MTLLSDGIRLKILEELEQPAPRDDYPIAELSNNFRERMVAKYESKQSQTEARKDAIQFAGLNFLYYKFEDIAHPEYRQSSTYSDSSREEAQKWEAAVRTALLGDWTLIKEAIQEDARSAMEGATSLESLKEMGRIPEWSPASEASERDGQALSNLASSI